jgi:hypothetical protein
MELIRMSKKSANMRGNSRKEWPAVVYFWIIGLALVSYVVVRVVLNGYPHPYHWLSALAGSIAGIPLGWLWYRWRGDVF